MNVNFNLNNIQLGDRVEHIKELGIYGTIVQIDPYESEVTTCKVVWNDSIDGYEDIQWTNKLQKVVV